jgi:hypothetical protein
MKISVKVDYACRVMAELARLHSSGELAQIEQLAKTEEVPASFLAQILGKLRTHGLIVSRRVRQAYRARLRWRTDQATEGMIIAITRGMTAGISRDLG